MASSLLSLSTCILNTAASNLVKTPVRSGPSFVEQPPSILFKITPKSLGRPTRPHVLCPLGFWSLLHSSSPCSLQQRACHASLQGLGTCFSLYLYFSFLDIFLYDSLSLSHTFWKFFPQSSLLSRLWTEQLGVVSGGGRIGSGCVWTGWAWPNLVWRGQLYGGRFSLSECARLKQKQLGPDWGYSECSSGLWSFLSGQSQENS